MSLGLDPYTFLSLREPIGTGGALARYRKTPTRKDPNADVADLAAAKCTQQGGTRLTR